MSFNWAENLSELNIFWKRTLELSSHINLGGSFDNLAFSSGVLAMPENDKIDFIGQWSDTHGMCSPTEK